MKAIEVRELKKRYPGGVEALRGLSFEVEPGQIFGLLGPNGAGKSTTVRILATLSVPTSGAALVCGIDVVARPQEVRRQIGYVSQNSTVDFMGTGRENLRLQGNLYGLSGKALETRIAALLDLFDLTAAAGRLTQTYSGGMRRRLDVAIGLVHQPKLLILDEPTTGLDPESRVVMWREIARLAKQDGMTILVTTHYLEEADRLSDQIAIVDGGLVVASGTPDQLKATLRGDLVAVEMEPGLAERGAGILRSMEGVTGVLIDGATVYAQTPHGARAIPGIVGALESAGLAVAQISSSRPSLDEVYLSLTGKSFQKADAAGAAPGSQSGRS